MKDKARTRWMKMVYGNQIKKYFYEEYVSFDNLRRIRTYCVLEDMYFRLVKLDEYGIWKEETIEALQNEGYVSIFETPYKKLLKNSY